MLGSRLLSRFARASTVKTCNRVNASRTSFKSSGLSLSPAKTQWNSNQRFASTASISTNTDTLKSDSAWFLVAAFVGANALYFLGSSVSGQDSKTDKKNDSQTNKDGVDRTQTAKVVATPAGPQKVLPPVKNPEPLNYEQVYKEIAELLEHDTTYDDGSFGPILVRLAWHCSGTYDKAIGNGGSNKATMRFKSESEHGGNAGLHHARDLMEKVHQRHPQISYGDLWTLAGVCAIQQMGGPVIPWRSGRTDGFENDATPDGRLPDASKGASHIRDIFYRMGFNDKDIVALSGAHALGRCHTNRSGYDGPWTPSPTVMTNDYYKQLLEKTWVERKWNGPKQYEDKETRELMMLPTDVALLKEPEFRKWVEAYAKDEKLFFKDFSEVVRKLFEQGVPFKQDAKVYRFKTIE